jgi:hypothetical protein
MAMVAAVVDAVVGGDTHRDQHSLVPVRGDGGWPVPVSGCGPAGPGAADRRLARLRVDCKADYAATDKKISPFGSRLPLVRRRGAGRFQSYGLRGWLHSPACHDSTDRS